MTDPVSLQTLERPSGSTIAYHFSPGKSCPQSEPVGVMFLGGFMSDMSGTKATALERHFVDAGRPFIRFDYTGHGQSSGEFADGTIGQWCDDALAVLDHVATGPQVLVGSSMGGWISLLAALKRPDRIAGLAFIAPAPDFTEELMWPTLDDTARQALETDGLYRQPSEYSDEPYTLTRALFEDGRKHLLLRDPIALTCPVRILQGMEDPDIPWQHALRLVEKLDSDDVVLSLVKAGDHRLSEPDDIARLTGMIDDLCAQVERE